MTDEKLSITSTRFTPDLQAAVGVGSEIEARELSFGKYFISRSQTFPYTESGNKLYFSNHLGTTEYYLFQSEI